MKTLRRFFTPPIVADDSMQAVRLLHPILLSIILLMLCLMPIFAVVAPVSVLRFELSGLILLVFSFGLLGLEHGGRVRLASGLLVIMLWVIFTALAATGAGVRAPSFIGGHLAVIVITGLLLGGRAGVFAASLSMLTGLGLVYAESQALSPSAAAELSPIAVWIISITFFWVVATVQYLAAGSVRRALNRAHSELAERLRTEGELRASEQLFKAAFIASPLALCITRLNDGRYIDTNDAYERLLGYSRAEIIGRTSLDLGQWDSEEQRQNFIQSFIAGAEIRVVETEVITRAGEKREVVVHYHQLVINGQQHLLSLFYDITDRNRSEEKIRQSAQQLAMLNEIGRAVAALRDLDNVLELIRQQVERVIPLDTFFIALFDPEAATISFPLLFEAGQRWVVPDSDFNAESNTSRVIQTGEAILRLFSSEDLEHNQQSSIALIGNAEQIPASLMYVPLTIKGKVIGVISVQSLAFNAYTTEHLGLLGGVANQAAIAIENARLFSNVQQELAARIHAESERENIILELEKRNAELERFTYTVSHDLKSPLITIRGFLGYLEKDALAGNLDRLQSDLSRIADATTKMQRLLDELLDLSRIGRLSNPPEEFPFELLAREALELVAGRIMARGVRVVMADHLPVIYGDRARLVEVMQNLLDNAVKFMGDQPEPQITIGVRATEVDLAPIFFVRDNGIGIDQRYYEKIFGLFDKLDPRGEGTGVGLALVKRIIEVHGGRIWVESEGSNSGSIFCFTLPTKPEKSDPQEHSHAR